MTLLLARKVKLPKCQEIPIISAGGKKNNSVVVLGGCDLKNKKNRKLDLQQWIT